MSEKKLYKKDIEPLFFEYKKMEGTLQHRVGIELRDFRFAPNIIAQDIVNSRLLIDLFSIVDTAIEIMFDSFQLKQQKGKSKLLILEENDKLYKNSCLQWYKSWRNEVAHNFRNIEAHSLRQASDDVQHQLLEWKLISQKFEAFSYEEKVDDGTYRYGAIINDIPVLLYKIMYRAGDGKTNGPGCNWGEDVNLSLEEYFLKRSKLEIAKTI